MTNKKHDIESAFFEFLKMKTFLENGMGMRLGSFHYVPLQIIPHYINSLLIIDLFSVWESAVNYFFEENGLTNPNSSKKRMKILEEKKLIENAAYIKWYIDWRNDVAHHLRKVELFELQQATNDVQKQMVAWKLIRNISFGFLYRKEDENNYKIGVRINSDPILEYTIKFTEQPGGLLTGWSETANLSLDDYLKLINEDPLI
ncbi:MAG: hypothetical protein MUO72_07915 [Bacteroidales bacterium]|nr:hypothetical protein [Bacteroidales bacterium]